MRPSIAHAWMDWLTPFITAAGAVGMVSGRALALALFLVFSVSAFAQTKNSAASDWEGIYEPIDGLTIDMRKSMKPSSPEWWRWHNRWYEQVTRRGMAFWDAYPLDDRRWQWLYDAMFTHRLDHWSSPQDFATAESRRADAAWGRRGMEFRAAMMARAMVVGQDAGWQAARWNRLYDELETSIRVAYFRSLRDQHQDPDLLLNQLIDFCIEVHLAGYEHGLLVGRLISSAIDLALKDDLDKQATFIDALTAAMQDLPLQQENDGPQIKEYISSTLRPLHEIRLKPLELRMTSLEGKLVELKQLRGKVVLVDFWNTGCAGCLQAMPHIQKVYDRYRDKGFEVIGVVFNTEQERELVEKLAAKAGAKWPQSLQGRLIGKDRSPLAQRFNFTGVPWTFLLDKEGKLVSTTTWGDLLEPQVRRLLGLPRI